MKSNNRAWLITGVAGFIGSNLLLELLQNNCKVVGIDSFITGKGEFRIRKILSIQISVE